MSFHFIFDTIIRFI